MGPFSAAEYKTLMMRYDILALPYDPQVYGNKPSGIFAEAVGLEKIVVVPASIRMAKIVQRHDIGVVYEDYSAAGLAADFDEAISHL